jgi:hypothetical protein
MSKKNLGSLPICIEKHVIPHYHDFNSVQRAAFITSTLWDIGTTIKVAFFQLPSNLPQWYTIQEIEENVPSGYTVDPIEYEVRKMNNITDAVKYVIQQRLQPIVNVNFQWVDNTNDADVRINFDVNNGSWSYIGQQILSVDKSQPTMNFAWLDVGTFIHEFCHTLGMIHEHQNPYGKGIQWNTQAVYQWAEQTQGWDQQTTYNNILKKYSQDQINGSNYDPMSIMLYYYPASLTTNGVGTTENHQLSSVDKQWLTSIYPQSGQRVFPTRGTPTSPAGPITENIKQKYILILVITGLFLFLIFKPHLKDQQSKLIFIIFVALLLYIIYNLLMNNKS